MIGVHGTPRDAKKGNDSNSRNPWRFQKGTMRALGTQQKYRYRSQESLFGNLRVRCYLWLLGIQKSDGQGL